MFEIGNRLVNSLLTRVWDRWTSEESLLFIYEILYCSNIWESCFSLLRQLQLPSETSAQVHPQLSLRHLRSPVSGGMYTSTHAIHIPLRIFELQVSDGVQIKSSVLIADRILSACILKKNATKSLCSISSFGEIF